MIGTNVGCLLGFSTGHLFSSLPVDERWRAMCLLGTSFPVVMIILTATVLPETPRWLVLKGQDDEAAQVLQKIYPLGKQTLPKKNVLRNASSIVAYESIHFLDEREQYRLVCRRN